MLRPDLSDLSILTFGTTATPYHKWSIDLMYHRYIRGSGTRWAGRLDVKAAPGGRARHLGDEVDAVFASQAIRGIDLTLVVGVFQPGAAFVAAHSPALIWRPQVRFYF